MATTAGTQRHLNITSSTLDASGNVLSGGNVGIGTTSPGAKLHVVVGSNGAYTTLVTQDDARKIKIGRDSIQSTNLSDAATNLYLNQAGANVILPNSNSRFGIGTTSPSAKFHVHNGEAIIASSADGVKLSYSNGNSSGIIDTAFSDNNLEFRTNGTAKMWIANDGNVGIGTTSPAVSLDISATDAIQMPVGLTSERPTGTNGMLRYNSSDNEFEGYIDGNWGSIGGGSSGGNTTVVVDTFSGDNSDTTFNITNTIANEDNVQIYIDGVYQSKSNYSTSGATITFSTAPPSGTNNIEVTHFVQINGAPSIEVDTFNGNASTTVFTLTTAPATKNNLQIYIDGVYQAKVNYSVSGTTLTFTTAPATGTNNIEVTHLKIS